MNPDSTHHQNTTNTNNFLQHNTNINNVSNNANTNSNHFINNNYVQKKLN